MNTRNLAAALATTSIVAMATPAYGQTQEYNIPAGSLKAALDTYAKQTGRQVIYKMDDVQPIRSPGVKGTKTADAALKAILAGTGFQANKDRSGAIAIVKARRSTVAAPQQPSTPIIVVTGTNIRGVAPDSSPLIQFDRRDIELSGASTLQEFIQTVPQNFGGGVNDEGGPGPGVGGSASVESGAGINLRGLGNGSTLVLLNGKRLAASSNGSYVDISMIPISAIERVDLLTDGASALYGSDAVSGVVNIVLREDFEGSESVLRYGTVTEGASDEFRASQTFGTKWRSGNGLITYDYYNRSALDSADREFTKDAADPRTILPNQERHSVFALINQDLGSDISIELSGLYSDRKFDTTSSVDLGTFAFSTFTVGNTQQINLNAGVEKKIGPDWQVKASASYSSASGFRQTETPIASFTSIEDNKTDLWVLNTIFNGKIAELPGGEVRTALGGEYRKETLASSFDVGVGTPTQRDSDRDVFAVFGEVHIPLIGEENAVPFVNRLEIVGAARYERYSDFGSTTDPKLGLVYEPTEGILIRGTYGTSFRAPILIQLDDSTNSPTALNRASFSDPTSPAGFVPFILNQGRNNALGPETSTTWTIGVDWNPGTVPDLAVNVTYFDIRYENRIDTPASGSAYFTDSSLAPFLNRNPTDAEIDALFSAPGFRNIDGVAAADVQAIFDNRLQNLAVTEVRGLDYSIGYLIQSDAGTFNLTSAGSYYFDFANQLLVGSPLVDSVDTVFNPADFKMRSGLTWSNNGFSAAAFVNYVDGYVDNRGAVDVAVDSWTTVDLSLSYRIGPDSENKWSSGWVSTIGVTNLFDQDPPFVAFPALSLNYDSANANVLGRFISFQISKSF